MCEDVTKLKCVFLPDSHLRVLCIMQRIFSGLCFVLLDIVKAILITVNSSTKLETRICHAYLDGRRFSHYGKLATYLDSALYDKAIERLVYRQISSYLNRKH